MSNSFTFPLLLLMILNLSFLLNQTKSLTIPSDVEALQAFKNTIDPKTIKEWSCVASWDFKVDPCSLPQKTFFICGITCSSDATRITSIELDPIGYSGTLSPLISLLTELKHLYLAENSFSGSIPSSISSLVNLETLVLSSNSLSGNLPPSLNSLKSLKVLDVSSNSLTGDVSSTSLSALIHLKSLDLSFNKLTGSLPRLPTNLAELVIRSNDLTGYLSEFSFHGLNQLAIVDLSGNRLTGALQGWFFQKNSMQQVNLSNNSITAIDVPNYTGSNLVSLDLGFNKIEGILPVNFRSFPYLASLSLRYNQFRGDIPYGNMPSFRRLMLDGNYLSGRVPDKFFANATSSSSPFSGSFGANCLENCPVSLEICLPPQRPVSVCKPSM